MDWRKGTRYNVHTFVCILVAQSESPENTDPWSTDPNYRVRPRTTLLTPSMGHPVHSGGPQTRGQCFWVTLTSSMGRSQLDNGKRRYTAVESPSITE